MKKFLIAFVFAGMFFSACASSVGDDEVEDSSVWLDYENQELGVSFSYPDSCSISESETSGMYFMDVEFDDLGRIEVSDCALDINVYTNPDGLSVEDWATHYREHNATGVGKLYDFMETELGGQTAYAVSWGCCMSYRQVYLVPVGDYMYLIGHSSHFEPHVKDHERGEHVDGILGTIEF